MIPAANQSPLFHAVNSARYERQALIREYEELGQCRLAVMIDSIFEDSITYLEELLYDADPAADLHLMLVSQGGDGEAAVRLVRAMQSRCRELTVIIPTQAKSAATLLALGAHHLLMAPFSDLGPVDPQFLIGPNLVAAKDIIAAVDAAAEEVRQRPETYPFYAYLLQDISAVLEQQARSAMGRSSDLLLEALRSNPSRTPEQAATLAEALNESLIERPQSHAALFSDNDALAAGLPVIQPDMAGQQWQTLWRLC